MPVDPPSTPPILAELVKAHQAFIERTRAEQQHIEWLIQVADEIDAARAAAIAERTEWLLYEVAIIDWKLLCFSDSDLDSIHGLGCTAVGGME